MSVDNLTLMIGECLENLEEIAETTAQKHCDEILNLMTLKKGYKVKVKDIGKKHTDTIIEDSLKNRLDHQRLYKVCEEFT